MSDPKTFYICYYENEIKKWNILKINITIKLFSAE